MVKKIVTLCALLLLVTGCYELGEIETSEKSGGIYFSIATNYLNSKNADSYILSDLSVAKDNCEKDCVIWTIIRKSEDNPGTQNKTTLPVKYGDKPNGMKVSINPVDLSTGKYTVAATVGFVKQDKIIGGGLVHGRFELIKNKNNSRLTLK